MAYPPTIPIETPLLDIERTVIDLEPPGMFPEEQGSFWGQMRRLFADYVQANAINLFDKWYTNLDPRAVDADDVPEWEYLLGLSSNTSLSLAQRKSAIVSRVYQGPFTRAARRGVIEQFILPTFGEALAFGSGGISLGSGVSLFSGVTDMANAYQIHEDVENFMYVVSLRTGITVDAAALARELKRLTPAGIQFSVRTQMSDYPTAALTVSGNEITDTVRTANVNGDGRAPESSFGIWEATTNLIVNSGAETDTSGWGSTNATLTRTTTSAKFGAASFKNVLTVGTGTAGWQKINTRIAVTANLKYSLSAWLKRVSGNRAIQLEVIWYTSGGAYISQNDTPGSILVSTSAFQRVTLENMTAPATAATADIFIIFQSANGAIGDEFHIDGIQFEQVAIATPYVATSRGAAHVQAPASLLNETQGWFACRIRPEWNLAANAPGSAPRIFVWKNAATTQWIYAAWLPSPPDLIYFDRYNGTASPAATFVTAVAGVPLTVVFAWTATQLKLSVNGSAFNVVANTNIPSGLESTFDIGCQGNVVNFDGEFLWAATGKGTLTQEDATYIGSLGDTDNPPGDFPGDSTAVWTADNGNYRTW